MSLHLSKGQSRLAAIGLLLFVLLLMATAIAVPTWWLHKRYDTKIDEFSDRLERYRRVEMLRPDIERSIVNIEKLEGQKYYLKGGTPTLITAELQGLLTRIIESNQGRMISSQVQPVKDEHKTTEPAKVSVSVQLVASIVPLQLILNAIEGHTPYLFIDQLTVRANQGRGYKPVPGVQPEFSVQLTVSGFSLSDGSRQ
jgi:general secretion pathway protein M